MDWGKEQEAPCLFNYGTKPSGQFKAPVSIAALPSVHANGVVYAPRAAGAKKSQSVESYNHGGVVPVNEEAKAVEKATYLVYSLQQAQDKLLQASATSVASVPLTLSLSLPCSVPTLCAPIESPVLSPQEINATLAAADYYQAGQQEPTPLQGWHYPLVRPASIGLKVPNIVMSLIPQGIMAPMNAGAVSPRGTFSPIEMSSSRIFATQAQSPSTRTFKGGAFNVPSNVKSESTISNVMNGFVDITNYPLYQRDNGQYRNLPSSNLAHGSSPL